MTPPGVSGGFPTMSGDRSVTWVRVGSVAPRQRARPAGGRLYRRLRRECHSAVKVLVRIGHDAGSWSPTAAQVMTKRTG